MYFKPFIFTTLTIWCFTFLTAHAGNAATVAKNALSANAVSVGATAVAAGNAAEVTEEPQSQSLWLYRNEFNNTSGFPCIRYEQNNDPSGGKTCEMVDDFTVPYGQTWKIDTLKLYLFWYGQNADRFLVNFFKDDDFGFPIEPAEYSFTFTADLTAELTLYNLDVNTSTNNLVLTSGIWWVGVIGIYDSMAMPDDTATLYWNRKDTLLADYGVVGRDSIGAAYSSYPIGWLMVSGPDPENPENSLRFWLRGTSETAITTPRYKVSSRVATYPNPAKEYVTFTLDNAKAKQIEMYNMKGKMVDRTSLKKGNNKVPVANYKNGVYTYRLIGSQGKIIDKGRFTVSR